MSKLMNMIKQVHLSRILAAVMLALGSVLFVTGCQDQGPAEEAGEAIDDAMEDAGEAMEDAEDDLEDTFDDNDN